MFIVRCIPTPKKSTERNPKVYYYEDTWTNGTVLYNTSRQLAKTFANRLSAEKELNPLLHAGKIKSYKIEPLED